MTARIRSEQPALFWAFLFLMLLFYFMDLGTELLVQVGITKTQLGGDVSERCFNGLFLLALTVANAGSKSLSNKLESPPIEAPKVDA